MHYISSYFVFDLIGSVPFPKLLYVTLPIGRPVQMILIAHLIRQLKLVRMWTSLDFSRQITYFLGLSDTFHKILRIVVVFYKYTLSNMYALHDTQSRQTI